MKKENKKKLLVVIVLLLALIVCFFKMSGNNEIANTIEQVQDKVINEIQAIDENILIEDITENEELSSDKNTIDVATIEDEEKLETEEVEKIEIEGFQLENEEAISYDGDRAKTWNVELGAYQGLTYYSQIDNRWKNNLFTSTNNKTQTIGSSGCGPTCASMVVSSIKGTITPDTMANLFVQHGYRSADNGTYWSAYRAVADEFNIGYTEISDINKVLDLLRNNNYVICSVGNGLFTTGGHYIVLVGIEGNTLKIYDPYNYSGKFETSTRRGKVVVEGNTIYCSVDNFKAYANYKGFFCYQNTNHDTSKYLAGQRVLINEYVKIAYGNDNYFLVDDGNNQFWIHKSVVTNDSRIYGLADVCYDGGSNDIVQIFTEQFWCNEQFMSNISTPIVQAQIPNTVGQTRILKQSSIIYQNSNLSGLNYNYKANTTVTILQNVSSTIDKVKVNATGRTGYIRNNLYK